jgi:transcriptional regulator with XRE-family HTH domain
MLGNNLNTAEFLALFEHDKTLQRIAECRYVNGMTIEETAMVVGYSERQISRLSKKIMERTEQKSGWMGSVMNTFLGGRW